MTTIMYALVFNLSSIIVIAISCGVLARTSFNSQQEVLIIKNEKGQVYDCVDFYKQPAFSHPFIKNQIFQGKPTWALQSQAGNKIKDFRLKDSCPEGTVPILRTFGVLKPSFNESKVDKKFCNTGVRTKGTQGNRYFHANALGNVYKSLVYGNQWSASRIKLHNGPETIEAGWMINPNYYKDSDAHFYVRFNGKSGGCYNVDCPGFVQVSKDVTLGMIPAEYSQFGSAVQKSWNIFIDKREDGHWWVSIDADKKAIGYWPKTLFGDLSQMATQVEWGGEISNPDDKLNLPYMGSGLKPRYDTTKSSFFHQLSESPQNTEAYNECEDYTALDVGDKRDYWRHIIFYGGPYDDL